MMIIIIQKGFIWIIRIYFINDTLLAFMVTFIACFNSSAGDGSLEQAGEKSQLPFTFERGEGV